MLSHPIVIATKWPEAIDALTANNIDEESLGLVQIGHGKSDVFGAA
jgi:hypothetical protein